MHKAQNTRGVGCAVGARLAKLFSKSGSLDESTMRSREGEERRSVDLLPKIITGSVPELDGVCKILLNDGPDLVDGLGAVAMRNKPVGVQSQCSSSQRRTIALRATPRSCECCEVDVELGLAKTASLGTTGWVGDALEFSLGRDVFVDLALKRLVSVDEALNQDFVRQRGISGPCVPVWKASQSTIFDTILDIDLQSGSVRDGLATTAPGAAP